MSKIIPAQVQERIWQLLEEKIPQLILAETLLKAGGKSNIGEAKKILCPLEDAPKEESDVSKSWVFVYHSTLR